MLIAKTVVIDTYIINFPKNSMIYKIHIFLKRLAMQLMHVDINICFEINRTYSVIQNQYMKDKLK